MKIETENIIRNDLEIKFRKNIINILKDLKTNSTKKGESLKDILKNRQ
ncbi:hypothetical protein CLOBAR_02445 [Intestinibacter bartlettii DSM 16795]|nr:hypothetical protein CLOBAR_02445 [Intestinibacter bartlettii DSM 16795]